MPWNSPEEPGVPRPDLAGSPAGSSVAPNYRHKESPVISVPGKASRAAKRGARTIRDHMHSRNEDSRLSHFFVELFSGSEAVSNQLRARGFEVFTFDKLQGPSGDLLRRSVLERVLRLMRTGMCLGVFAGIECRTFSVMQGGRLRSAAFPAGLPNLPDHLRDKVKVGNALFGAGMVILSECIKLRIPFILENPQSSRMWDMPTNIALSNNPEVQDVVLDYCGYGARWRKTTKFRCFMLSPAHLARRCRPVGKLCGHSLQPHIILEGRDPTGVCWTSRASEYPAKLATALARLMIDGAFASVFADRVAEMRFRK